MIALYDICWESQFGEVYVAYTWPGRKPNYQLDTQTGILWFKSRQLMFRMMV
jgi:hypothetical protein